MHSITLEEIKNNLYILFSSISNREIASLFWITVFFIFILSKGEMRSIIGNFLKTLFQKPIIVILLLFLLYTTLLIWIYKKLDFWSSNLEKDTILWVTGTALILVYNSVKAQNFNHFKEIIKDAFKWLIVLEFLIGFYTFSLTTELILIPFLTYIYFTISYIEVFSYKLPEKAKIVSPFLNKILSYFGIFIFGFVIFKTVTQTSELLTFDNFKSFLLPLLFTISFIPFIYLIALYSAYEQLWLKLDHNIPKKQSKKIKRHILLIANFNINKLSRISDNIAAATLSQNDFSFKMIKKISNELGKNKNNLVNAKIDIFNDVEKTRNKLSNNGIGNLSSWKYDFSGGFLSITNYYSFGEEDVKNGLSNNLAYYIESKNEYCIQKLELVLNLNNKSEKELGLNKFKELVVKTYKCLELQLPLNILDVIGKIDKFEYKDLVSISILETNRSNIDTLVLSIKTK